MFLPFAEYMPDQPDVHNPGSSNIINVVPRTEQSYGPVPTLANGALSALAARCQGAVGARDSANNTYNFAGTAAKLYKAGTTSWSDVSLSGGYNVASSDQWHFTQFGDLLIATNVGDTIQSFTLTSSTLFANIGSGAPKARYACVSKNFLLVGSTNDGSNGSKPQRVWWPKIGDPTTWPTLGGATAAADQSDAQDIVGDQGWITGLVANVGPLDVVVFFERAVYRAMYIGSPAIWGFWPMNGGRGCPVPGSIQRTETGVIFVGPDDIYLCDGTNFIPIGNQKVGKTFWDSVDKANLAKVSSAVDPYNKLYYLAYPSLETGTGALDRILVCHYGLNSMVGTPGRFSKLVGNDPITGKLNGEYLFIATNAGYNADSADALFNTDTSPYGPDDPFWVGNGSSLSLFDATTHIMQAFSSSNGSYLKGLLETSEKQIVPNRRAYVTGCRPLVNGGTPTVTPYTRNADTETALAGTGNTIGQDGYCFFRTTARYHRFRMTMLSSDLYSHATGIDLPDFMVADGGLR